MRVQLLTRHLFMATSDLVQAIDRPELAFVEDVIGKGAEFAPMAAFPVALDDEFQQTTDEVPWGQRWFIRERAPAKWTRLHEFRDRSERFEAGRTDGVLTRMHHHRIYQNSSTQGTDQIPRHRTNHELDVKTHAWCLVQVLIHKVKL